MTLISGSTTAHCTLLSAALKKLILSPSVSLEALEMLRMPCSTKTDSNDNVRRSTVRSPELGS
jgi:hypothetical protein